MPSDTGMLAQAAQAPAAAQAKPIPAEQLDSLVAPIALYPDPLLSQTLVASTYPLEIVQLQQWLAKNKTLKDKALTDAVMKQPWDPSIQSMAFIVSHDGVVYQKDLGPDSLNIAKGITRFNPDKTWTPVGGG